MLLLLQSSYIGARLVSDYLCWNSTVWLDCRQWQLAAACTTDWQLCICSQNHLATTSSSNVYSFISIFHFHTHQHKIDHLHCSDECFFFAVCLNANFVPFFFLFSSSIQKLNTRRILFFFDSIGLFLLFYFGVSHLYSCCESSQSENASRIVAANSIEAQRTLSFLFSSLVI